ncbi:multimeric flavodoxin WrbA [Anaerosolibacter carboniphilus]|uniref:Multimeric flavodoxin WrbA n=1 Tax=Anaerosolibacter carboniphilus TaxID=1417629 RepID=A0A841KQ42_9FIRM|nr:flavodoxin family protein [Anaerosolibacter carboniphilus]MBB6214228.1 multimeric flavodoxin WrbA [Anaerosolibacter carboniphilus]
MKIIAFNGSPRKNGNTAILLNKVLEGAASQGAETEVIHLYDLNYKGCISCFSCRLKNRQSYGKCAVNDDLTAIFKAVEKSDSIILGSPIYMGSLTGEMKSFLERLLYPLFDAENLSTLFKKKIVTGFIYTMGVNEIQIKEFGYEQRLSDIEITMQLIFGTFESLIVTDTYQYDDYSKYVIPASVNPAEKSKRRKEVFPKDCQKAFEMGERFAKQTNII